MSLEFTVYCHPEPQGSSRAFIRKGKAIVTSANAKLKPYRHIVTAVAQQECPDMMAGKQVPVGVCLDFFFERPPSVNKKRRRMVVKPDIDKLVRATLDSLTGVLFVDDAQVVSVTARKHYGLPERVVISAMLVDEELFGWQQ